MRSKILCLLLVIVLALSMFVGCAKSYESTQSMDIGGNASPNKLSGGAVTTSRSDSAESPAAIAETGYASTNSGLDILSQRKIIRNANITIEVEDYNQAYSQLQTIIDGIGYIGETNISKDY